MFILKTDDGMKIIHIFAFCFEIIFGRKREMNKLITSSDVVKWLHLKPIMKPLVSVALNVLGFRKINKLYSPTAHLYDKEFVQETLRKYNITCDISENDYSCIPKEGGFAVVSNHPFGAIEGLILYDAITDVRPDFKVMANFILSKIPNLKDVFFSVNPFENNKKWSSSAAGIKASIVQLSEGHGLGIFPAGEVSRYHGNDYPEDIKWSASIAKLIKNMNVPVIPVYFDGTNSRKFYTYEKINSFLGTLRLPKEILNKRNKKIVMKIGKPIQPSEMTLYEKPEDLAAYLRSRSYSLQANMVEENNKRRIKSAEPIDAPVRTSLLVRELNAIRRNSLIFTTAEYECYLADYDRIPRMMHEIGRRREEAFRAIGEGTGKGVDTDEYDKYYKHLILWDTKEKAVAGGYRLGIGDKIMEKKGIKGFYINSLFEIDEALFDKMKKTIELGRSFVSVDYQKDILPLMLLLKGLMFSLLKFPKMEYFIGPVSISSWYPKFYQSMMVYYVREKHAVPDVAKYIHPTHPFVCDFNKVDINVLMEKNMESVDKFDRYLMKLSNNDYRMPTLFKKYLKINAKFLCFNVDPDFNDTLDGLLFLRFADYPREEILMMTKDCSPAERATLLHRFGYEA